MPSRPRPAARARAPARIAPSPRRPALPPRLRLPPAPPRGRLLTAVADPQGALRILAHVSGDPGLTAAFAAHEDLHRSTAARVLKLEPADVTYEQRSMAKMVNFGVAYGMSDFGLADRLRIPRE